MRRKYELDFLDTFRTGKPCGGMSAQDGAKTSLEIGTEMDITWHLGYPHGGDKLKSFYK